MELALAVFNIGAGLGVLAAGLALGWLAIQATPLLRETRALASDTRRLAMLADDELRPILASARELTSNVEVLSEDVAVKLDRLTDIMNAMQHSLDTVQITTAPRQEPEVRRAEPEAARWQEPQVERWDSPPRREAEVSVESWRPAEPWADDPPEPRWEPREE
jgi:uncharacterized protein YoxC